MRDSSHRVAFLSLNYSMATMQLILTIKNSADVLRNSEGRDAGKVVVVRQPRILGTNMATGSLHSDEPGCFVCR